MLDQVDLAHAAGPKLSQNAVSGEGVTHCQRHGRMLTGDSDEAWNALMSALLIRVEFAPTPRHPGETGWARQVPVDVLGAQQSNSRAFFKTMTAEVASMPPPTICCAILLGGVPRSKLRQIKLPSSRTSSPVEPASSVPLSVRKAASP